MYKSRTTLSQDVQTWSSVQLAFAKFLSKIKENFLVRPVSMILLLNLKFSFILDRNLAKANCTGNHVRTSCDTVVLGININLMNVSHNGNKTRYLLPEGDAGPEELWGKGMGTQWVSWRY